MNHDLGACKKKILYSTIDTLLLNEEDTRSQNMLYTNKMKYEAKL